MIFFKQKPEIVKLKVLKRDELQTYDVGKAYLEYTFKDGNRIIRTVHGSVRQNIYPHKVGERESVCKYLRGSEDAIAEPAYIYSGKTAAQDELRDHYGGAYMTTILDDGEDPSIAMTGTIISVKLLPNVDQYLVSFAPWTLIEKEFEIL